jgi:hypothetical protein
MYYWQAYRCFLIPDREGEKREKDILRDKPANTPTPDLVKAMLCAFLTA